jgi:hypothetical protein
MNSVYIKEYFGKHNLCFIIKITSAFTVQKMFRHKRSYSGKNYAVYKKKVSGDLFHESDLSLTKVCVITVCNAVYSFHLTRLELYTSYWGADKSLARPTSLSIVFSVQGTGGSPMGPDLENSVGDQDTGSPGRPVSSGLLVPSEPFPSCSG